MKCKECKERERLAREAFLKRELGETIVQVAKGAVELVGLKPKTALLESKTSEEKQDE